MKASKGVATACYCIASRVQILIMMLAIITCCGTFVITSRLFETVPRHRSPTAAGLISTARQLHLSDQGTDYYY